jgi:Domain of unknown function (DUF4184)
MPLRDLLHTVPAAASPTSQIPRNSLQGAWQICESLTVMPFTFAHPVAVLPLRRFRFLQTVPLIIGSVVPDAPYFFPERLSRASFPDTHTLYGSFTVCVPLGMALLIAILLLREPLTVLLGARPRWLCLRSLERFLEQPMHWPVALLSILVGAWTHLIWDSFTHETGWTTARVAALSAPVSVFGWDTATSHLLQYLSSVFGLAVMALWLRSLLARVPRRISADPARPRASWLALLMVSFFALLIGVSRSLLVWHASSFYHLAYLLLTRTIGWFLALYLVAGMLTLLGRRLEPEPAS